MELLWGKLFVSWTVLLQIPSKTGSEAEKKEVLLEDHDPVWLELRHAHIADVGFLI